MIFSEELINLFIAFTPVWLKPHLSPYTRQGDGLIECLYSIYLNVSNLKEYIQRDMLTYSVHFLFILFKRACRYERSYIIFFFCNAHYLHIPMNHQRKYKTSPSYFVLRRYTVLTYFEEEIKQGWNDGIHRYCIHHGFITVISYKAIGMIFILFAIFLFQGEFISNFATNFANMV